MISITVKFPVRPDRVEEWLPLAKAYADSVNSEEGSLFFEWSRALDDENVFVAIEGFRDADAGAAHTRTAHFADFVEQAPALLAETPQIIYIDAPEVDGFGPMGEIQPEG